MAYGISPVVPLQKDDIDGFYVLTKTLKENTKQNFKNLLLTSPGERVMLPDFGIGIKRFLFEHSTHQMRQSIAEQIDIQTEKYMPFISVESIEFIEAKGPGAEEFANIVSIEIYWNIPGKGINDLIKIGS
jgi:phage baseplate assembly protein W